MAKKTFEIFSLKTIEYMSGLFWNGYFGICSGRCSGTCGGRCGDRCGCASDCRRGGIYFTYLILTMNVPSFSENINSSSKSVIEITPVWKEEASYMSPIYLFSTCWPGFAPEFPRVDHTIEYHTRESFIYLFH